MVDRGGGDAEAELDLLEGLFALEGDVGVGDGSVARGEVGGGGVEAS